MSDFGIRDNTGSGGYGAEVDANNDLHTFSITESREQAATLKGDSYNVNSGFVTFTVGSEEGILYLKNNETRNLHVSSIICILGTSTGGTNCKIRVYKNPTTGELISDATAADINSNRDFDSGKTLDATAYKGDGATSDITDGSVHIGSIIQAGSRVAFNIDEILRIGNSIAITYECASNTSMECMAAIVCNLQDENRS